jgi:hypothetical protein
VLVQECSYGAGIVLMLAHAHGERLGSAQREEAVERTGHGADRVLMKFQRVVHVLVVGGDESADDVGVPTDILRRRMHDDIRSQVERRLQVRRRKRVVHGDERSMAARDGGHFGDVHELQQRIRRRLQPHDFRIRRKGGRDRGDVRRVHVREREPVAFQHAIEQTIRAAVDVIADDRMIAGGEQVHDGRRRAHAAREAKTITRVFQRRQTALER